MMSIALGLALGNSVLGDPPLVPQDGVQGGARDDVPRYTTQWIRLKPDTELFARFLRGDAQLAAFGNFHRTEAGETLELAALRLGLDPARVAMMNPQFREEIPYLCTDFRHRCLPGEGLAQLASLYEVEIGVLRQLNDLDEGQEPADWDELCLPSPLCLVSNQIQLRLPIPLWSRLISARPEGGGEESDGDVEEAGGGEEEQVDAAQALAGDAINSLCFLHRMKVQVAQDGDTWNSLAQAAQCSANALRNINTDAGEEQPVPGSSVRVGWQLEVRPDHSLEQLVLYFEHFLRLDLDHVLEANGLEGPAQMLEARQLFLPYSSSMGYEAITFQEDRVQLAAAPGCQVGFHFKGGPEGVTHELRFH